MRLVLTLAALLLAHEPAQPCALQGNMRFVQRDATYKIFVVEFDAQAHPVLVSHQATQPGQWRPVDVGTPVAFTVQIVPTKDQADFTVRFMQYARPCQ